MIEGLEQYSSEQRKCCSVQLHNAAACSEHLGELFFIVGLYEGTTAPGIGSS